MARLYLTTTLPYVNADPHIGFALELVQADAYARHRTSVGDEVFFNTGTDEHGQKIYDAATKAGKPVREYVDHYANEFRKLKDALGLSDNLHFIRTTDEKHLRAAERMWELCKKDIEMREFEGLYCVGCEKFLTEKEIVEGKCHIHGTAPELLKEKNYFFKLSQYKDRLLAYLSNPKTIIPDWRREEAIAFVKELEDVSVSRERERLSWGVPVPGDETQVMYVWFEALVSYLSTLGWPTDPDGDFKTFWEGGETYQFAGKDQVRFQSILWQAMLMSAGLKNTDQVFYHGFINSDGQKMSKSLGNVISPYDLVKKYGTDATRYLLLRHVHPFEDSDVTWGKLDEWYNAGLANGLGNLVARVMKLAEDNLDVPTVPQLFAYSHELENSLKGFEFNHAMDAIWDAIQALDQRIQREEPYKTKDKKIIAELTLGVAGIGSSLAPFMPDTSQKILAAVAANKKPENLFSRI